MLERFRIHPRNPGPRRHRTRGVRRRFAFRSEKCKRREIVSDRLQLEETIHTDFNGRYSVRSWQKVHTELQLRFSAARPVWWSLAPRVYVGASQLAQGGGDACW